jgi:hypothetical protein
MRAIVVAIIAIVAVSSASAVVRANRSSHHLALLPTGPMPPVNVP